MTISPVSPKSPLDSKTSAIKDEITLIWSQVQARVIELAGGDATRIRQNLTIDNVLAQLDQVLEDSSPKESAIRSTLDTTLKFIDTVGGVVAGGASEVSLLSSPRAPTVSGLEPAHKTPLIATFARKLRSLPLPNYVSTP